MTTTKLKEKFDEYCENVYLEYVNDYLTLEVMSLDKNMSVNALKAIVDHGRQLNMERN